MTGSPGDSEETLDEVTAARLLPERDPAGHKGTFGHVVVVAGSFEHAGAALMAGAAALRAGGGLVTLCVPASVRPHLIGRVPELILRGLPERATGELDAVEAAATVAELPQDALLIGPGLAPDAATARLVVMLLAMTGVPAIVDAGALTALASVPGWWDRDGRERVLTPHPGELARLGRAVSDDAVMRREAAIECAAAWRSTLVLKGADSVIAAADGRVRIAPFTVPALATAGTGDVLGGIIASLVGQGLGPFDAAGLGVYLHARCGEDIADALGDAGLMATDLLPAIPLVRRRLANVRERTGSGRLGFEPRRS